MFYHINNFYHSKYINFLIWALAAFFYSLQMSLRMIPGMMMDHMTHNLGMTAGDVGLLAGFYYLGYAGLQIPVGILLDRYHPRLIIASCILIASIGIILTIYATSKFHLYIARFLIGMGSIAGILGSIKAIDDFFPKKYSFLLGMTMLCGVGGSFYGGMPVLRSINKFGIEITLLFLAYIAFALCALILIFYRKSRSVSKKRINIPFREILTKLFSNKEIWLIGILSGLMIGPLGGFADLWGARYLCHVKHISFEQSAMSSSAVFAGLGVGCTLVGWFVNKYYSSVKIIIIMGVLQAFTMSMLFYNNNLSLTQIFIFMFTIGFLSSSQIVVFSLAKKVSAKEIVSASTSIVNSVIMTFGFLFNFIVGTVLKLFFIPIDYETLTYSKEAYHTGFSIIIICTLAGSLGFMLLFSPRRRKKSKILAKSYEF